MNEMFDTKLGDIEDKSVEKSGAPPIGTKELISVREENVTVAIDPLFSSLILH